MAAAQPEAPEQVWFRSPSRSDPQESPEAGTLYNSLFDASSRQRLVSGSRINRRPAPQPVIATHALLDDNQKPEPEWVRKWGYAGQRFAVVAPSRR